MKFGYQGAIIGLHITFLEKNMLDVTLVGTGGALPLKDRFLSSCIMKYNGNCFLFDCGEGTQISLRRQKIALSRINTICITHCHADHVSGLPGLLLSMGNDMRTEKVTLIGPAGFARVLHSLLIIARELPFETEIIELKQRTENLEIDGCRLTAFRVEHAVPCYGYTLEIDRVGKFSPEKAEKNGVPMRVWGLLQKEETVEFEGKIYTRDMAFDEARRGIKTLFCTDTRPLKIISEMAKGADLMIYEGMFAEDAKVCRAEETKHSTFTEAARLAKEASPGELWLTHFSPSLPDPQNYISVATDIFPNTVCGKDGLHKELNFID